MEWGIHVMDVQLQLCDAIMSTWTKIWEEGSWYLVESSQGRHNTVLEAKGSDLLKSTVYLHTQTYMYILNHFTALQDPDPGLSNHCCSYWCLKRVIILPPAGYFIICTQWWWMDWTEGCPSTFSWDNSGNKGVIICMFFKIGVYVLRALSPTRTVFEK